jgi:hypothetical protein
MPAVKRFEIDAASQISRVASSTQLVVLHFLRAPLDKPSKTGVVRSKLDAKTEQLLNQHGFSEPHFQIKQLLFCNPSATPLSRVHSSVLSFGLRLVRSLALNHTFPRPFNLLLSSPLRPNESAGPNRS